MNFVRFTMFFPELIVQLHFLLLSVYVMLDAAVRRGDSSL